MTTERKTTLAEAMRILRAGREDGWDPLHKALDELVAKYVAEALAAQAEQHEAEIQKARREVAESWADSQDKMHDDLMQAHAQELALHRQNVETMKDQWEQREAEHQQEVTRALVADRKSMQNIWHKELIEAVAAAYEDAARYLKQLGYDEAPACVRQRAAEKAKGPTLEDTFDDLTREETACMEKKPGCRTCGFPSCGAGDIDTFLNEVEPRSAFEESTLPSDSENIVALFERRNKILIGTDQHGQGWFVVHNCLPVGFKP